MLITQNEQWVVRQYKLFQRWTSSEGTRTNGLYFAKTDKRKTITVEMCSFKLIKWRVKGRGDEEKKEEEPTSSCEKFFRSLVERKEMRRKETKENERTKFIWRR